MPPKSFFPTKKKSVDTTIILKNIDPAELDKEYNMKELSEACTRSLQTNSSTSSNSSFIVKKTTRKKTSIIEDDKNEPKTITTQLETIGITKETKKYEPTYVKISNDIGTKNGPKCIINFNKNILDRNECSNLFCWWCRNKIPTDFQILGCPLKFEKETFYCEGSFCSFNCIKAYIEDLNHYNMKYRESNGLLLLLYSKCFNSKILYNQIISSPHWSLLKDYGGDLTIEDFRKEFQRINYYGPSGNIIRDISKQIKTAYTYTERD